MADSGLKAAWYRRTSDKAQVNVLFNELSGFHHEFLSSDGAYNTRLSNAWETGAWPEITESHAKAIERDMASVRTGK